MKIIVDTNIVFSGILKPEGNISELLSNSDDFFDYYSSEYLKEEIENHKEKLLKISGYTEQEFEEIRDRLYEYLGFILEEEVPFEHWQKAAPLVREIDPNDIAFIALVDYMNSVLWTGDKRLINGLQAKGFDKTITTEELFDLRNELKR